VLAGFDHFIILVNNLDTAIASFHRLGFDARAGGEHPSFGSHNALVALADGTYIELVAFKDAPLARTTYWRAGVERLRVSEGWGGFVLASNAIATDVVRLQASLAYNAPQAGARVRPDGQRVEWHTSMFNASPVGLMPFLIQDDTPRHLRIELPREGIGSRARANEVIVVVKNLDLARDAYQTLLGIEPKRVHNAMSDVIGYRLTMDWGSIVLAHPERGGNAMAEQLAHRGEGIYALTLQVEGLGHERIRFRNQDIELMPDGNGFLIPPALACGARIRLLAK
jgi:hypothetical protein